MMLLCHIWMFNFAKCRCVYFGVYADHCISLVMHSQTTFVCWVGKPKLTYTLEKNKVVWPCNTVLHAYKFIEGHKLQFLYCCRPYKFHSNTLWRHVIKKHVRIQYCSVRSIRYISNMLNCLYMINKSNRMTVDITKRISYEHTLYTCKFWFENDVPCMK